jgi:hypothetical protein
MELENLMTERYGLGVVKKSHPRLLTVTEWLGTYSRIMLV